MLGGASIVDGDRTIRDFGAQWLRHPENDGYYASVEMFRDICGPLLQPADVEGHRVADLGSGSGRIVDMLLDCGAAHVTAVEPSDAIHVLRENTSGRADRITYVHGTADCLPPGDYDAIVSIGVLHHVPEPAPAVARALDMLKPGGRLLVWLYGREGNETYLALAEPLRRITSRIPDGLLRALCHVLVLPLSLYAGLCRWIPLPMRGYMRSVITPLSWRHRALVIFDQLNPAYAKYYSEQEACALIQDAGFADVEIYHRHGYSWTVSGRKPATTDQMARR